MRKRPISIREFCTGAKTSVDPAPELTPDERAKLIAEVKVLESDSLDNAIQQGIRLIRLNLHHSVVEETVGMSYSNARRKMNLVTDPKMQDPRWMKPRSWTAASKILECTSDDSQLYEAILRSPLNSEVATKKQVEWFLRMRETRKFVKQSTMRQPSSKILPVAVSFENDFKVHIGDALTILKTMPDESVHCVVTSVPYYGLRDYEVAGQIGLEETPEEFIQQLVKVFQEVRRVLRSDGTCWVNVGDSYAGNNKGKCKRKDLIGIPWMLAFPLRADGWHLRSEIIFAKVTPIPEASDIGRPTKSHEQIFLLSKSAKYYYNADAIREKTGKESTPEEYAAMKEIGTWQSGELVTGRNTKRGEVSTRSITHPLGRNKRDVWAIAAKPFPGEAHHAVFPPELPRLCIFAGTSEFGCCSVCGICWNSKGATCQHKDATAVPCVVLDPFSGSGTCGIVAVNYNRAYIGIELNEAYTKIADDKFIRYVSDPKNCVSHASLDSVWERVVC